jgi:hypothetical protein
MPRRVEFTPALIALIRAQDGVVAAWQLAEHGVGPWPAQHRVDARQWQRILPGILLTHGGEPTRRQRLIAAQLWGGEDSAIDAASAAFFHRSRGIRLNPKQVHIVTPFDQPARSRDWVTVRRTIADIEVVQTSYLRYVVEPMAVLVAARDTRNVKRAVDVLSRALQSAQVTLAELQAVRSMIGDKGCGALDKALEQVGIGLRSPAEMSFRDLAMTSKVLPEPLWNQWLDLGDDGQPVCADGLWIEAITLHEVNGKRYHAWGWQYESTSARMERVTASDLVYTQSTPLRIVREPAIVLGNLERTYLNNLGRPWPPGVKLIDPPSWAVAS